MALTVTHNNEHEPLFSNESLLTAVTSCSYGALLYELLSEQKPNAKELELFELLLKFSIDHGPDTPSAKVTIAAARDGISMGKAVGDGMQMINETHGGAGEPAMRLFYDIARGKMSAEEAVIQFIAQKKRLPGFGHRLYKKDPRAEFIVETINRLGFPKTYFTVAREMGEALATQLPGKTLPLNIDGAIAAALCTLGWKPAASTALFIIARSAGLCAHYLSSMQEFEGQEE